MWHGRCGSSTSLPKSLSFLTDRYNGSEDTLVSIRFQMSAPHSSRIAQSRRLCPVTQIKQAVVTPMYQGGERCLCHWQTAPLVDSSSGPSRGGNEIHGW